MPRKILFDTNGITTSCPISDIGVASISECGECDWFGGLVSVCEGKCEYDQELVERQEIKSEL